MFGLLPTSIGHQDVVSLLTRQPAVAQRARAHILASPFGSIHAATFSFPRPLGTLIPEMPNVVLASLGDSDDTGSVWRDTFGPPPQQTRDIQFPEVNRRLKGDSLAPRTRPEPEQEPTRDLTPGKVKTVSYPRPVEDPVAPEILQAEHDPPPALQADIAPASEPSAVPAPEPAPVADTPPPPQTFALASLPPKNATPHEAPRATPIDEDNPAVRLAHLYFGEPPAGTALAPIEPWPADYDLVVHGPVGDPDIKRSALTPADTLEDLKGPAQTVAPKGEVTGPDKRLRTPAERLHLDAKGRAKAEKCLADAVYFESRGEVKRGQIAVAQVVMNRVFSGFYPNTVCGVVYQNAHRRNACQFTFACDGIPDVVNEPDMWKQAQEIARDMLDGKLWLPEIGYSTHYHAYWVHPSWVNEMRRLHKIGVHSFYRPRAWGDTVEVPNYTFVPPTKM